MRWNLNAENYKGFNEFITDRIQLEFLDYNWCSLMCLELIIDIVLLMCGY